MARGLIITVGAGARIGGSGLEPVNQVGGQHAVSGSDASPPQLTAGQNPEQSMRTGRSVPFPECNGLKRIDLSDVTAIIVVADVLAGHMTQSGGPVLIDGGAGNTITVQFAGVGDMNEIGSVF